MTVSQTWIWLRNGVRRRIGILPHRPIFVLGMQKSGTTVIAALTARRAGLTAALDLVQERRELFLPLVQADERTFAEFITRNRRELARSLVKEPMLTPFLDHLVSRFPRARFGFVLRDPRDTIRSILNRLDLPGHQAELTHAQQATISPAWWTVLDGTWLGLPQGSYIEQLAHRWRLSVETYLRHQDRCQSIRYETFQVDKTATIDGFIEDLGLIPKHDISTLLDHPFQPPGDATVAWSDFFGRENLARIETICGDHLSRFGYDPEA